MIEENPSFGYRNVAWLLGTACDTNSAGRVLHEPDSPLRRVPSARKISCSRE